MDGAHTNKAVELRKEQWHPFVGPWRNFEERLTHLPLPDTPDARELLLGVNQGENIQLAKFSGFNRFCNFITGGRSSVFFG